MEDSKERIIEAKQNEEAFAQLAEEYRSWILKTASNVTNRYITDSDDEWSIALSAFHEAVQSYDESKGSFSALAAVVIKRRILDWLRTEARHSDETSVSPAAFDGGLGEEEATATDFAVQKSMTEASMQDSKEDRAAAARAEIEAMQAVLKEYGFSFFDLAECSPKAEKTKQACGLAVRTLIASVAMMALMRLKKLLPIKELSEASGVVKKILERHRKYIIAAAEILDGDYPILASYMAYIRKG
ncbi:MAG: RNA polymerase subunit sigma [Firmicutes bacterium]|nr:RNA polymerase subunit sigma [Bacillota bacterium]